MRYLREIQLEVHMSIYKMLINCSPSLAWGYVNAGFLLLQWELFQAKGCDIIHLSIDIFKEGLQCNRCSINAGEFHTNLIWSYDEKLTEMHSTLIYYSLPPTFQFPARKNMKKEREKKGKIREKLHGMVANVAEEGQLRWEQPLISITSVGSTQWHWDPGRPYGQRLWMYVVLSWKASLEGQGIFPLRLQSNIWAIFSFSRARFDFFKLGNN